MLLSVPCIPRSYVSSRSKRSSSRLFTSSSSLLRAKSVVKEEKARLRLEHTKKRQLLKCEAKEKIRRHQEEEEKTKEKLELL